MDAIVKREKAAQKYGKEETAGMFRAVFFCHRQFFAQSLEQAHKSGWDAALAAQTGGNDAAELALKIVRKYAVSINANERQFLQNLIERALNYYGDARASEVITRLTEVTKEVERQLKLKSEVTCIGPPHVILNGVEFLQALGLLGDP